MGCLQLLYFWMAFVLQDLQTKVPGFYARSLGKQNRKVSSDEDLLSHCNSGKPVEFVKVKVGFLSYKLNRVLLFNHVVPRVYAEPKGSSTISRPQKLTDVFFQAL